MSTFEIISSLICLTAAFSYLNFKFLKMPASIGVMILSILFSLVLVILNGVGIPIQIYAKDFVSQIDFHETLMNGILCFLLFAGALHVDIPELRKQKHLVTMLSSLGLVFSILIIGYFVYGVSSLFQIDFGIWNSMIFGALISPTDPVAVLTLMKNAGAGKGIRALIAGESLFNDGFGVVAFIVVTQLASQHVGLEALQILKLLTSEVFGGLLAGLILGQIGHWLLTRVDNYHVAILLTLALVSGGYCLAQRIHVSGVLAMVVTGLMLGNHERKNAMPASTRHRLEDFWEIIDEVLNSVLFVLIGIEVLVIPISSKYFVISLVAILIVLAGRLLSVGITIWMTGAKNLYPSHLVKTLTWGGLRGGISIALALSLPASSGKELTIFITYSVVLFSLLVQANTFKLLLRKFPIKII